MLISSMWKERNSFLRQGKALEPRELICQAITWIQEFQHWHGKNERRSCKVSQNGRSREKDGTSVILMWLGMKIEVLGVGVVIGVILWQPWQRGMILFHPLF